jgi:hypothetical protein
MAKGGLDSVRSFPLSSPFTEIGLSDLHLWFDDVYDGSHKARSPMEAGDRRIDHRIGELSYFFCFP